MVRRLLLLLLLLVAAAKRAVVTASDVVVVASGAASGERFAAAQLAQLLGNATGTAVAVGTVTGTVPPGARRWAVGYGASLALGVPASQLDGLGAEGFATAVLNGSTAVAVSGGRGAARGAVFGVFGLLRQLGFRFYAPDETAVPTAAAFEQAAGSLIGHTRVTPAMIWRSVESGETNGADPMQLPPTGTAAQQAQNYLWLLRARNNGMDTGFGSFPVWAGSSAHTSYTLLGASAGRGRLLRSCGNPTESGSGLARIRRPTGSCAGRTPRWSPSSRDASRRCCGPTRTPRWSAFRRMTI